MESRYQKLLMISEILDHVKSTLDVRVIIWFIVLYEKHTALDLLAPEFGVRLKSCH